MIPMPILITRIKRLVAGSVNGLDYDNVTVIGDRARFSESPLGGCQGGFEKKNAPSSMSGRSSLQKNPLTRFRIIFFSFTIILLILLLTFIWMLWKIMPILRQGGRNKTIRFPCTPSQQRRKRKTEAGVEKRGNRRKRKKRKKKKRMRNRRRDNIISRQRTKRENAYGYKRLDDVAGIDQSL